MRIRATLGHIRRGPRTVRGCSGGLRRQPRRHGRPRDGRRHHRAAGRREGASRPDRHARGLQRRGVLRLARPRPGRRCSSRPGRACGSRPTRRSISAIATVAPWRTSGRAARWSISAWCATGPRRPTSTRATAAGTTGRSSRRPWPPARHAAGYGGAAGAVRCRSGPAVASRLGPVRPAKTVAKTGAAKLSARCNPNYTPCIPNSRIDLDCADIGRPVRVVGRDVYGVDRDGNGRGCERSG